jgi:hypothetical protein
MTLLSRIDAYTEDRTLPRDARHACHGIRAGLAADQAFVFEWLAAEPAAGASPLPAGRTAYGGRRSDRILRGAIRVKWALKLCARTHEWEAVRPSDDKAGV